MTAPGLRALLRGPSHDASEPVPDWRVAGRCVGWSHWPDDPWYGETSGVGVHDTPAFFRAETYARALCAACAVHATCLEDALAHESTNAALRHGIRGGLDPRERANLARSRQRAAKREAMTSAARAAKASKSRAARRRRQKAAS